MAPDRLPYRVRCHLLGEPLTTERVSGEKLDNRTALGVLASDCISSSAYGSEEMLRVLVPVVGVAGFTLLMPVTGAILLVLLLLTLCYSDVVMIYTRAGGSYVVARENFGPGVAQIAGASVDRLVALYAIGVFTAFTMAGGGLTAYHLRRREPYRRVKIAVNALAALVSAGVVLIFAVTKFTEGAWLVVVVFPLGVWALTRINREYRRESAALQGIQAPGADRPTVRRHQVSVLVEALDLATLNALRYAHELHPDTIRAVHFAIDEAYARRLAARWAATAATSVRLEVVACPDRRLRHAMKELASRTTEDGDTWLTVRVPRRLYPNALGKLLHRGTGEQMAKTLGRLPHVAVTILPFHVPPALTRLEQHRLPPDPDQPD